MCVLLGWIVGFGDISLPSDSLPRRVVFPALSRPKNSILASRFQIPCSCTRWVLKSAICGVHHCVNLREHLVYQDRKGILSPSQVGMTFFFFFFSCTQGFVVILIVCLWVWALWCYFQIIMRPLGLLLFFIFLVHSQMAGGHVGCADDSAYHTIRQQQTI